MNPIKKFAYASTEIFLLNGAPYTGYYNISNNVGYVGKYSQTTVLDNYPNIQNAITRSDLFLNRLPTQNITLTYSLSDFIFQPNEFINSNSIDNKLQKAFVNYLDVYRACFMASSKLPYNLSFIGKVSSNDVNYTKFIWAPSSTNTAVSALSTLNSLITRESKIVYASNTYNTNQTLILANSGSLMVYNINPSLSTFAPTFSSFYVETGLPEYGSLQFNNITDISRYGTNLYVCDYGATTVYAYDISGVLQGDRALKFKFNLTDSVNNTQGGFITPKLVSSSSDTVYIYDSSQHTVFFYDTSFNLKNSYKNEMLFTRSVPASLTYYRLYDQLFILTEDFKVVVLDKNANAIVYNLSTQGNAYNEVALKIIFSNNNSDIFYLLTNLNLYKKFVSNVFENIGKYSFVNSITGINTNNSGSVLYDIDILENDEKFDNIMLYGYDQFLNYKELTLYNTIIK